MFSRSTARAGLLASILITAAASAQSIWPDPVVPYRGPVEAPGVMGGWHESEVILRLAPGATIDDALAHLAAFVPGLDAERLRPLFAVPPANAGLAARFELDRGWIVTLPEGNDPADLVARLNADAARGGAIERAELNGLGGILSTFPNDPSFNLQYGLHNTGQTINGQAGIADADIDAPEAWDYTVGSAGVVVAVIDTGVSFSHPDITPNRVPGWDVLDNNASADDSWLISHGTHCAGIIGARGNNGIGVSGVNWVVGIMPVRVLNDFGAGTEAQVAAGIVWAADHGAHVASLSLGFPGRSAVVDNAVAYAHNAGVVVVAASGNTAGGTIGSPAAAPEAMAVGATNNRDQIASFTTTGPEMSVTAPGVDVYSTWDTLFSPNTYSYQSGTSMACPHVSGLAALVLSVNPALTNVEVRAIIESTADDKGAPGWDETFGHGRINAHAAVLAALAQPCPADFNGDTVINTLDVLAFLNAYTAGEPEADFNGDTVINTLDVLAFLNAYTAGCD
ncbi:MAG: hypothetical protein DYG93_07345 [Leptolyngbya sp. PLA2]|nr:hypothetical protein [Leptolyngbya sp.]MCE7971462.1 hypothetical protein [Leptolyngbya sp. PL-A2]MCQ3940677.1 hypothetical protein [cyanobacterium CYA1]MCZ7632327.1 S8 family serine peptidase [Phycisphaerales bacterium]MDL1903646.1 hypothetical protein [Synechococcales cyanobacterium CNB]GIK18397.1 MAG: hypothetical protein BroJett004_05610 [Planctomycetota bacterium]